MREHLETFLAARVIEGWYRDKARVLGIAEGRTGSITAVQSSGAIWP